MTPELEARIKAVGSQVVAQLLKWGTDRMTARLEIVVTDGTPVHVHRNESVRIPREPLDGGRLSACHGAELINLRDFGLRGDCPKCGEPCVVVS